jgi:hypothetical protein
MEGLARFDRAIYSNCARDHQDGGPLEMSRRVGTPVRVLLWLLFVDLIFLGIVLIFNPHSSFPEMGAIGALFFYPTNLFVGLLPYLWYYQPLFQGPRNPAGILIALTGIQLLIMIVVTVPALVFYKWLRSRRAMRAANRE